MLSYFDEAPSWLAATVTSMGRLCDHVIAVDGRYLLFDHEMSVSPVEQAETIVEVCTGAGLPLTMYRPSQPFIGGEVAKRNLSFKLAMAHAEPMEDWLLVLDGDTYISNCGPRVRDDLEKSTALTASFVVQEYMDVLNPAMPIRLALKTSLPNVGQSRITLLYRCVPGIRYEGTHYSICGEVDGVTTWLWGHDGAVDPMRIDEDLVIRHRNMLRPARRREQAAAYYTTREELQIEARPA